VKLGARSSSCISSPDSSVAARRAGSQAAENPRLRRILPARGAETAEASSGPARRAFLRGEPLPAFHFCARSALGSRRAKKSPPPRPRLDPRRRVRLREIRDATQGLLHLVATHGLGVDARRRQRAPRGSRRSAGAHLGRRGARAPREAARPPKAHRRRPLARRLPEAGRGARRRQGALPRGPRAEALALRERHRQRAPRGQPRGRAKGGGPRRRASRDGRQARQDPPREAARLHHVRLVRDGPEKACILQDGGRARGAMAFPLEAASPREESTIRGHPRVSREAEGREQKAEGPGRGQTRGDRGARARRDPRHVRGARGQDS
jgi:hypothetical protein